MRLPHLPWRRHNPYSLLSALLLSLLLACGLLILRPYPLAAQEDYTANCSVALPARTLPEVNHTLEAAHRFATGQAVRIAVIDTGVAPHPRLGEVIDGGDLLLGEPGGALRDCDGHGTIVAGIIAARPDPRHDGLEGIAPGAQIISIRQSSGIIRAVPPTDEFGNPLPDDGSQATESAGNLMTLTDAVNAAIDLHAHIISMSVVSCVPSDIAAQVDTRLLEEALHRAERAGIVVLAAAGNKGGSCQDSAVVFPAHYETVLAVSALSGEQTIADYSMPSHKALLSARGATPVGLSPTGQGWAKGLQTANRHKVLGFEGTSFATPVVTGVVALLKERYPRMTPAQIRATLHDAVDPATGAVNPLEVITHLNGQPGHLHTARIPQAPTSSLVPQRASIAVAIILVTALVLAAARTLVDRKRGTP